jgi:hypothetical protein
MCLLLAKKSLYRQLFTARQLRIVCRDDLPHVIPL